MLKCNFSSAASAIAYFCILNVFSGADVLIATKATMLERNTFAQMRVFILVRSCAQLTLGMAASQYT